MLKRNASVMWLLPILLLAGCATTPEPAVREVPAAKARLSPPPPEVMVPRVANYRDRLLQLFSTSPMTPTETSDSSASVKR